MGDAVYRYKFSDEADMKGVEETLLLSVIAVETLHGRSRVNLDAEFQLDENERICEIDGSTRVGRDIARIFTGLLTGEYGERAFTVSRVQGEDLK